MASSTFRLMYFRQQSTKTVLRAIIVKQGCARNPLAITDCDSREISIASASSALTSNLFPINLGDSSVNLAIGMFQFRLQHGFTF